MKSALLAALLVSAAALAACATLDYELMKNTIDNLVKQVIAIEDNKKIKSETDYLTKIAAMTDSSAVKAPATGEEREPEQEEESDSAPFMIVVEHTSGRRCGGSLVSLRTALTSASCVSGEGGAVPSELWALAPGASAARRVARVALAAGAVITRADDAWSGAAMDLAVLELEAPFGAGVHSRPILMATQPSECAASSICHVVRALGRTPRLRIVDATLVSGDACANRSPVWPGLRESALCLVGPTLCSSDWGTGVVCEGKLCGVMSRSSRAPDDSTEAGATSEAEPQDDTCGDTHVAQNVARWRRFLHCAHTLRACGSGGDCALLCSERRLLDTDSADSTTTLQATEATFMETVETTADTDTPLVQPPSSMLPKHTESVSRPVRLSSMKAPTRSGPTQASLKLSPQSSLQAAPRPAFDFEPNRPDFKGGPARTSRVYLKAGEYGDNAAEYGGEEALLPTSPKTAETMIAPPTPTAIVPSSPAGHASTASPTGPRAPAAAGASAAPGDPSAPTARTGDMQARVSPATGRSRAAPRPALAAYFLYVLVVITSLVN